MIFLINTLNNITINLIPMVFFRIGLGLSAGIVLPQLVNDEVFILMAS